MAVYVGPLTQVLGSGHGKFAYAARLTADSLVELLLFASRIGVKRRWLIADPEPHFDLTPGMRARAVKLGALPPSERGKKRRSTPLFEGLE